MITPPNPIDSCCDGPMPDWLPGEWERFLASDAARPAGLDVYEDIFANGLLFPLQRKRELAAMMALARTIAPSVVMEIGADKGSSFYHWIKCQPTVTRAIAAEIRGVPYADAFRRAFPAVDVLGLAASTPKIETRDRVGQWLQKDRIDCLFLDGSKAFLHLDYDLYLPLVKPGGWIFIHDVNPDATNHQPSPPARVYESICRAAEKRLIVDTSELAEDLPDSGYARWLQFWGRSSCGVGCIRVRG